MCVCVCARALMLMWVSLRYPFDMQPDKLFSLEFLHGIDLAWMKKGTGESMRAPRYQSLRSMLSKTFFDICRLCSDIDLATGGA